MKTDTLFSSKSDEWETPESFFQELDREFHFDLDACASDDNHKCEKYFTREQDGLSQDWGGVLRMVQSALQRCKGMDTEMLLRRT